MAILALAAVLGSAPAWATRDAPRAVAGVIDLRNYNFEEASPVDLEGQWEVLPGVIVGPEGFGAPGASAANIKIATVPSPWGRGPLADQLPVTGKATYRVTVLLPENAPALAMVLPRPRSAARIWVNGALFAESGLVGNSADEEQPTGYRRLLYLPLASKIELVMALSNHTGEPLAGPVEALRIGDAGKVGRSEFLTDATTLMIAGAVLMFSFYHIVLYSLRRDPSYLQFALLTFAFGWISIADHGGFWRWTGNLPPWAANVSLLYFICLVNYSSVQFLKTLVPLDFSPRVARWLSVMSFLPLLFVWPGMFESPYGYALANVQTLINESYFLMVTVRAVRNRRDQAGFLFLAILALLPSMVHDFMVFAGLITGWTTMRYVFAVVLCLQAWILARRFAAGLESAERLGLALRELNRTLESQVEQRTQDLVAERGRLQGTLSELKATQAQLVTREKMASLGQLTAGIAHEIKNPLNFVTNYAEVSGELTAELRSLLEQIDGPGKDAILQRLADLDASLTAIKSHGSRADRIVRTMLAHARGGAGEVAEIDVNTLVSETADLAWHGWRAERPGADVEFIRSFDPDAGHAKVVPQEISRVVLNLISNALHAVSMPQSGVERGRARIELVTRNDGDHVVIEIADNGIGMDAETRSKLFTPFFTTKAAGEGTGLGLSLSWDIVVQQHRGSLTVESAKGLGSRFRIRLPRL